LGNVLTVITDRKAYVAANGEETAHFESTIVSVTDYSPFGAPLTQRTWSSDAYRYGFNGKEKDSDNFEGAYDFGARIMDVRLGRWMSVDPAFKETPHISCFVFCNNIPIYYYDSDGKRFKVVGDETKASDGENQGVSNYNIVRNDVYSLIPSGDAGNRFRSLIDISTSGEVTLKSALSRDEVTAMNDPGIELLYNLITSENDFVYEVNNTATTRNRAGETEYENIDEPFGMSDDPNAAKENNQISNTSITRMLKVLPENPTDNDKAMFTSNMPSEIGVEGQVVIAPVTRYVYNFGMVGKKSRSSIVFHELSENYYWTENGLPYAPSSTEAGAHNMAIADESALPKGDSRKSPTPGKADVSNDTTRQ